MSKNETFDDDRISEIDSLNNELSSRFRKIDERKLNAILDSIPNEHLTTILRRRLPKPSKKRQKLTKKDIPPSLSRTIRDISLLDEQNDEKRLTIFIGYCRYKGYSYNTVKRYVAILKSNGIFGNIDHRIQPSKLGFGDAGKIHTRAVSVSAFASMCRYLHNNFSKYTAPILVAVYTGLRTFEILQWSTLTLHQLRERQPYVSISRKQTVLSINNEAEYWKPVYTTQLNRFIDEMLILYKNEYDTFVDHSINNKLFYVTSKTLVNRIRQSFIAANNFLPPLGFGIHSCRNMIATLMARSTDNVGSIKTFLQHKNVITTKRYINADFTYMQKEFDRLTRTELSSIGKMLKDGFDNTVAAATVQTTATTTTNNEKS